MDAFTTLGGVTPLVSFKPKKPEGLAQISFSRVLALSELSDRYVIHSRYCVLGPLDQLYLFIFLFPSQFPSLVFLLCMLYTSTSTIIHERFLY